MKNKLKDIMNEIESYHHELPLFFQELEFKKISLKSVKNTNKNFSSTHYNTSKLGVSKLHKPILRIEK